MEGSPALQLSGIVDTYNHVQTINEVKKIFSFYYPQSGFGKIQKVYTRVKKLFEGKFSGYRECNTQYHDFRHTLDALLASARILDGYNLRHTPIPENTARNLLIAALLHDTGYIQESWDTEGTGAKYTKNHVLRSVEFTRKNYDELGLDIEYVPEITQFIQCTGLNTNFNEIPFMSRAHKICGACLGTADLLGQMADREYLEKLLFLYYEFREAGVPGYDTEFDIIKKTEDFYVLTRNRLKDSYMNVQRYTKNHFSTRYHIDSNLYMISINRHIRYLRKIIRDETTNFRHKLKRGDQHMLHTLSQQPPIHH